MAITYQKLEQFIKVCECGNMTRAAEQLFITQSALSQSITSFEHEIGCSLFERRNKSLVLNREGEIVLRYARRIVSLADDMTHELHQSLNKTMSLSVVAFDVAMATYLKAFFMLDHSDYDITVEKAACISSDVLICSEKDLAISQSELKGPGIESRLIFCDHQYVVVPPESPYCGRAEAHLRDFDGQPFYRSDYVLNSDTQQYAGSQRLSALITHEKMDRCVTYVSRAMLKLMLVRDSIAVNSFISALGMLMNAEFSSIAPERLVRLTDPELKCEYWLSWRRSNEKVHELIDWLFSEKGLEKYVVKTSGFTRDELLS